MAGERPCKTRQLFFYHLIVFIVYTLDIYVYTLVVVIGAFSPHTRIGGGGNFYSSPAARPPLLPSYQCHSLGQDLSTVAQPPETTVTERSLMDSL